jgi:hypothetical protein
MNYTLCLDPYSVNFDPSQLSGNGFNIYTDVNNFTSPIATNIPISSIFSPPLGNCGSPLSLTLTNIPSGATQILIVDNCGTLTNDPISDNAADAKKVLKGTDTPFLTECCYALIDIPEDCKSFCDDCNIEFDTIDLNPVGRIIAGELQSSCGTVTDYVIGWYRNGDYSSPAVTTGFGTAFPYQYVHPLTSTTAPMVLDGSYEGIILDAIVNGNQYSSVISGSGIGTPIPFESCFGVMVVNPLDCDNGNFPGLYSHQISLTAAGNGIPPGPTSATFLLDNLVNYFAYSFAAYTISDTIEVKFISGDPNSTSNPNLYSQPIYLDYTEVSYDGALSYDTNPEFYNGFYSNLYPKKTNQNNWNKILTLNTIERTPGDRLEITITPNPTYPETSWVLRMQCLKTFNCDWCVVGDSKLVNSINIKRDLNLSSCIKMQKHRYNLSSSCDWDDDLLQYGAKLTSHPQIKPSPDITYNFLNPSNPFTETILIPFNYTNFSTCEPINPINYTNIRYKKYNGGINNPSGIPTGIIEMQFYGNPQAQTYYNNIKSVIQNIKNLYFPIQYQYLNNDWRYYRGWAIKMPNNNGNIPCGDNATTFKQYFIHRDSDVTFVEDTINNYWSIKMTMPYVDPTPTFQTLFTSSYGSCCGSPFSIDHLSNFAGVASGFNDSSVSTLNLLDWTSNYTFKLYDGTISEPFGISIFGTNTPPPPESQCYVTSSLSASSTNMTLYAGLLMKAATTLPFIKDLSSLPSNPQYINLDYLEATPCPIPQEILDLRPTPANTFTYTDISYPVSSFGLTFDNLHNDPNKFKMYSYLNYPNTTGATLSSPVTILEHTGSIGGGPGGITYINPTYFVPGFSNSNINITNWSGTGPAPF